MIVIALSGPIASGKSIVGEALKKRFGGVLLKTSDIIKDRGAQDKRSALVAGGDDLDEATDCRWVLEGVLKKLKSGDSIECMIIDAVRKERQIKHLRDYFGADFRHLHVYASDDTLKARYEGRDRPTDVGRTYEQAIDTDTERGVRSLMPLADVKLDNERMNGAAAAALAAAELGLGEVEIKKLVDVVVGAQYGSEGKGNICAHIASRYSILMRVGGPNAGHKVPDPKFTFIHLPSGSLANNHAQVLIGAGATIDVETILKEIADLKDLGFDDGRLKIDPRAMIIEHTDIAYESKTMDRIGSTKKGVGAATARKILGRDGEGHLHSSDVASKVRLAENVPALKRYISDTKELLEKAYRREELILLEGTQGTTLSIHHGPYPNVTSRETTVSGCLADAGIAPLRVRNVIMVTRTYPIRVGGESGNIMNEIKFDIVAERSGNPVDTIEKTEVGSISGKVRRMGEFDWEQLRVSSVLNAPTEIAITFADYISSQNKTAARFEDLTSETQEFICRVEKVASARVSLVSVRFAVGGVLERSDP